MSSYRIEELKRRLAREVQLNREKAKTISRLEDKIKRLELPDPPDINIRIEAPGFTHRISGKW